VHVGVAVHSSEQRAASSVGDDEGRDAQIQSQQSHHKFPTTSHPSANMTGSPTPEERDKADVELKVKEAEEQAKLPYKWTQTISDLDVTIHIDAKYKGKDLDVKLTKTKLKVAIKGQEPFIDVRCCRVEA
jgi:hypothetical protein